MSHPFAPALVIRTAEPHGFVHCNRHFQRATGLDAEALADRHLLEWLVPAHRQRVRELLERGEGRCRVEHRTVADATVAVELRISRHEGQTMVLGRCCPPADPDSPDASPPEATTASGTLDTIARIVEEQNPGYRCSILLVRDGRFVQGAGPSLPPEYNAAIDGYAVGPTVGSCGTAIYWNEPVVVEDIARDPLWVAFAPLAAEAGVAACWSHPFTSSNGRVLGALALYAPEPRAPSAEQLLRLRAAARMTGLAVERRQAERELERQRARERELESQLRQAIKLEALGVLAGGVAHDFNNVLYTILTNAEHALSEAAPGTEVSECLRDIIDASRQASGFCRQMLDFAGRGPHSPSPLDLCALVPQVRTLARAGLGERARLLLDLPDTPVFVHGDEGQLSSLLFNLVNNAAHATETRGGTIVLSVRRQRCGSEVLAQLVPGAELPEGEYGVVIVEDDGCGMDEQTASRIFDPFFTTRATGRGLGLAAARGIVTRHGGAIQLRTAPGEGATFTLLLPLVSPPPVGAREFAARPPSVPVPGRLLLAEDNAELRKALGRQLRAQGFELVSAPDGPAAIALFEAAPGSFDVALLDYAMPGCDGYQVHAALRAVRPDLPVLIMTGNSVELVRARFEPGSISRVLQKPIDIGDLLEALEEARRGDENQPVPDGLPPRR
jgi:signal transduction histidine kinase/ActR/RegA family two-component response regulator